MRWTVSSVRTDAGMVLLSKCKTPLQCRKSLFTPLLPRPPRRFDGETFSIPRTRRCRSSPLLTSTLLVWAPCPPLRLHTTHPFLCRHVLALTDHSLCHG